MIRTNNPRIILSILSGVFMVFTVAACSGAEPSVPARTQISMDVRSMQPDRLHYRSIFDFPSSGANCPRGAVPQGTLVAVNGVLYGTTVVGGTDNAGTIFRINAKGKETVLFSFGGGSLSPKNPGTGLAAAKRTLFGTTAGGGTHGAGVVYGLSIASLHESVVYNFGSGSTDGKAPAAAVIAVDGILYGTTSSGGTYGYGTVFRIELDGGSESIVYSFGKRRTDGRTPYAPLLLINGMLYGTTAAGGAAGAGAVFSVDPQTGSERVLHSFSTYFDGEDPVAPLVLVGGKLYGTTLTGGSYDMGTVYSLTLSGKSESVVHSFGQGSDGASPYASVSALGSKLYGTTSAGGATGNGTIYAVSLKTAREAVTHSFGRGSDGALPVGGLLSLAGSLYGTTALGGVLGSCLMSGETGNGTVFALSPYSSPRI